MSPSKTTWVSLAPRLTAVSATSSPKSWNASGFTLRATVSSVRWRSLTKTIISVVGLDFHDAAVGGTNLHLHATRGGLHLDLEQELAALGLLFHSDSCSTRSRGADRHGLIPCHWWGRGDAQPCRESGIRRIKASGGAGGAVAGRQNDHRCDHCR